MGASTEHIQDELVKRCLQGDRDAFFRLYKQYSRSMYNVGYRIVRDEAEAEDVTSADIVQRILDYTDVP